jgi:hypothetical protein
MSASGELALVLTALNPCQARSRVWEIASSIEMGRPKRSRRQAAACAIPHRPPASMFASPIDFPAVAAVPASAPACGSRAAHDSRASGFACFHSPLEATGSPSRVKWQMPKTSCSCVRSSMASRPRLAVSAESVGGTRRRR